MSSTSANMKKTLAIMPRKTIRGHDSWISGVAHLPDGRRIITCSMGSLRLWHLESGAQIGDKWRDEGDSVGVRTIALSPNGKTLASGSYDGTLRLWDVEIGKFIAKWEGHTQIVKSVCWSSDGERVASGSTDGTVWVWDVESGEPAKGFNRIKTRYKSLYTVSYSPKATMIATGGDTGIEIWETKTGIQNSSSNWTFMHFHAA